MNTNYLDIAGGLAILSYSVYSGNALALILGVGISANGVCNLERNMRGAGKVIDKGLLERLRQ